MRKSKKPQTGMTRVGAVVAVGWRKNDGPSKFLFCCSHGVTWCRCRTSRRTHNHTGTQHPPFIHLSHGSNASVASCEDSIRLQRAFCWRHLSHD